MVQKTWRRSVMAIDFLRRLSDVLAPRACVICSCRLAPTERMVCGSCLASIPFTGYEQEPTDNAMARLLWGHVQVERCAALFFYKGGSAPAHAIYRLKYDNRPYIGTYLGTLTAQLFASTNFFEGMSHIVPVPLTNRRLRSRGYNQSEVIARGVAEVTGLPVVCKALKRTTFSESQTHKDSWERWANVNEAFTPWKTTGLSGAHVLLVDDVMTTGATAAACIAALIKGGVGQVSVLTLAVVKP